jgi:hypothetical protein
MAIIFCRKIKRTQFLNVNLKMSRHNARTSVKALARIMASEDKAIP